MIDLECKLNELRTIRACIADCSLLDPKYVPAIDYAIEMLEAIQRLRGVLEEAKK